MSENQKLNLLPGDYVFREGEFGQTAYIVESGTIELVKFTGDKDTVLAEVGKGALFGEMAIIESSPRSASARAKTEATLSIISEEALKKHLVSSPNTALDMMRRLASYARSANEKLSKDAFSEVIEDTTETTDLRAPKRGGGEFDSETKKTLREFNDELDEFNAISPSRSLAMSGLAIIIMVVVFGIWASLTEIDVTVSARGKIMTAIPNVAVQSNYSSVIKTILIEEGEQIKKGQPIAVFDETLLAADFRNIQEELSSVEQDIERVQAELNYLNGDNFLKPKETLQKAIFEDQIIQISIQKREHEAKIEGLEIKLQRAELELQKNQSQLRMKIALVDHLKGRATKPQIAQEEKSYFDEKVAEINSSFADFNSKILHLSSEVERYNKLSKAKIIPTSELKQKLYELEQTKLQKDKFISSRLALLVEEMDQHEKSILENQMSFQENSVELLRANLENDKFMSAKLQEKNQALQDLTREQQSLSEKFIKLSRQIKDVEVLSPVSGTVLKLEDRFEGSVINSGDVIATIVPANSNFHVEVDIEPGDITHVYEGADVKIMLDALPSQKHGELKGVVRLLSKDAVDEDVFGEKRSVYRADINITENNLVKLPDGFKLLPSMNVSGNIKSGKRTVITFLLFPVIKTIETSFREP